MIDNQKDASVSSKALI